MKPNNEFTRPDQRFFLPVNNEVEYHETFDTTGLPGVDVLPGVGYAVVTECGSDDEIGYEVSSRMQSGTQIKRLVGMIRGPGLRYLEGETLSMLEDSAETSYEPDENDLLVLQVRTWGQGKDLPLHSQADENGVILLPATLPLPYLNGESSGSEDEKANFELLGVITSEDRLIGWARQRGIMARDLIDLCVINVQAQNALERALLVDELNVGGSRSLIGELSVTEVAHAYLRYFDDKHGTNYSPIEEPHRQEERFPDMSRRQMRRFTKIAREAQDAWDKRR